VASHQGCLRGDWDWMSCCFWVAYLPTLTAADSHWQASRTIKGEQVMARNERRMVRKPATKFPNLRKKLQKSKTQAKQVKKK